MAGYIFGNRFKEREDKYVSCTWCGGEIYFNEDYSDDAYIVEGDLICERCFDEYRGDCKYKAERFIEDLTEEE